ncbi:MAG: DUF305 domain-containing protein, partial [Gemmatimonadota bacterium]|nr:DUF305 domain-containing protein [Gemmatimonadota bacterium]
MSPVRARTTVTTLCLAASLSACGGAAQRAGQPGVQPVGNAAVAVPFAGSATTAPNPADVEFMSGMIPHHAQAVLIAGWAATHTTSPDVGVLAQRIVVGQRDE